MIDSTVGNTTRMFKGPVFNWNTKETSTLEQIYKPSFDLTNPYDAFAEYDFESKVMINYGNTNEKLLVSRHTLRNEEMHFLY